MKHFSHLNTAVKILELYNGKEPFALFLKEFFKQDKKYGSRDRKNISELCYAYFRLGKALPDVAIDKKIIAGLFFCARQPGSMLQQLLPDLDEEAALSLADKVALFNQHYAPFALPDVFPWQVALSKEVDYESFCASFFTQPDLFLRLRPGKEVAVKGKLKEAGIVFEERSTSCIALPNTSKIDELIEVDKEAVIQDESSQRVGELLQLLAAKNKAIRNVWDCCAASGGKSIMAFDTLPGIALTVSDVRDTILFNLHKRFATAGIRQYNSFTADLGTTPPFSSKDNFGPSPYDLIIADVPCSGSGTWGRTPEQLAFFDTAAIERYSSLQKKIVHNIIPHIKPGGHLLYITCSVFEQENENVVKFIEENSGLQLVQRQLFTGYMQKADTLFAALFTAS
ncbi:MAG: Fmu (Sun) domain-containing protein [Chitinophagaceae bacterium]